MLLFRSDIGYVCMHNDVSFFFLIGRTVFFCYTCIQIFKFALERKLKIILLYGNGMHKTHIWISFHFILSLSLTMRSFFLSYRKLCIWMRRKLKNNKKKTIKWICWKNSEFQYFRLMLTLSIHRNQFIRRILARRTQVGLQIAIE